VTDPSGRRVGSGIQVLVLLLGSLPPWNTLVSGWIIKKMKD
jgi:hypothetical protein